MILNGQRRWFGLDPLGVLLCLAGSVALAWLPFVLFKANRILPGEPRALVDVLPAGMTFSFYATMALVAILALRTSHPWVRVFIAVVGIAVATTTAGAAASALTPIGDRVVRVAPGGAFWILAVALGLLATDALARLRPGPFARVACLAAVLTACGAALASGRFDDLSIMREYATNAARFTQETWRHVWLALGSLAAAVVVGLPLGIACHRQPRLRAAVLGTLNVVQTVPSIALFGMLMAPLGALAAAWPALSGIGVSGIGAAPAAVALFLYSLLPIVANTVVGLAQVSPAAVDAARGMGLTASGVLRVVELPLALPTLLAGIRIVLVQNVGLATIAALIGGGGLGTFVFQGIGQTAIDLVMLGALPIVALAFAAAVVLGAAIELTRRVPA
jgi:osmoprotectant transport system permease protein